MRQTFGIILVAVLCPGWLGAGGGAGAQESAATEPERPASSGPSYLRTLTGTVGGGILGAAAVGGTAGLLAEAMTEDQAIVPIGGVWFTVTAPVGYWLGQALGASWGASGPDHEVTTRQLLLPAALWTGAGLSTYVLIGDGFDPEDRVDHTSWYVGAALGAALQISGMSLTAYRGAKKEHRSSSTLPSTTFRVAPTSNGGIALLGRIGVDR